MPHEHKFPKGSRFGSRAWANRTGANIAHLAGQVVSGAGHVLGGVESHLVHDATSLVNTAGGQLNTLASGAESTLKVPLMIAAAAAALYFLTRGSA